MPRGSSRSNSKLSPRIFYRPDYLPLGLRGCLVGYEEINWLLPISYPTRNRWIFVKCICFVNDIVLRISPFWYLKVSLSTVQIWQMHMRSCILQSHYSLLVLNPFTLAHLLNKRNSPWYHSILLRFCYPFLCLVFLCILFLFVCLLVSKAKVLSAVWSFLLHLLNIEVTMYFLCIVSTITEQKKKRNNKGVRNIFATFKSPPIFRFRIAN